MHLAQLNIGKMKGPIDTKIMKEFNDNLDPINAIAEKAPGYVWRLKDESGNATSITPFDDPLLIVNMSVWENLDALKHFMLKTNHVDFLKNRYQWFEKMQTPNHVMWFIPVDHQPSIEEAKARLDHLTEFNETPYAFSMRRIFTPDDLKQ